MSSSSCPTRKYATESRATNLAQADFGGTGRVEKEDGCHVDDRSGDFDSAEITECFSSFQSAKDRDVPGNSTESSFKFSFISEKEVQLFVFSSNQEGLLLKV